MRYLGIFTILLLGFWSAQAQVTNPGPLQKTYNELYSQILFEKTVWPQQLKKQKLNVDESQAQYETSQSLLIDSQRAAQRLENDLDTQKLHLAFLKRVEPLSIEEKGRIKQRVVANGEFSNPGQVTPSSLSQKADQLTQDAAAKKAEIDQNQQKIQDLQNTPEYQGYIQRRSQLRRDKSHKTSTLDQVRRNIQNLEFSISQLRSDLSTSERREERARIRIVRIRQQEIPERRREIQNIRSQIQNLRQQTQQKVDTRRQVQNRRDQTKSKIQQKQNELDQEGANKQAIKAEIRELRQQLQRQNQRIDRLTSDIQSNRREIQRLENKEQTNEREINQLRNEIVRQERVVADEDIRQIRIEGDIRDKNREISNLKFEETNLVSTIGSINNQLTTVQTQINQYYIANIRPIEGVIGQLETDKEKILRRKDDLQKAGRALLTQDQNIAAAKEKVPSQENLIQRKVDFLNVKKQELTSLQDQTQVFQEALDQDIQSYNELVTSIKNKKQRLKTLEEQMIEAIGSQTNGGN